MAESDFCSGLCPQVVVPEHVDLWKVAVAVPVTGCKWQTGGGGCCIVTEACAWVGILWNFIKKKESQVFFKLQIQED